MPRRLIYRTRLPVPPSEVAAWHARPMALERLTPPWERLERLGPPEPLREGLRARLRMAAGPLRTTWVAHHQEVSERGFVDEQESGPFKRWRHHHRFLPDGEGAVLEDDITFALPLDPLSTPAALWVQRRMDRMFRYRHDVTLGDLKAHHGVAEQGRAPLTVAVTGSSGLVGGALVPYLLAGGHRVLRLARRGHALAGDGVAEVIPWDPASSTLPDALSGIDAVVHLAGEPLVRRWNDRTRALVLESRAAVTRHLAEGLTRLARPPAVLVSASAIGFYGDAGDAVLVEQSSSGHNFLAEVCRSWETACEVATEAGIRVVNPRLGLVLDARGGALARLVLPFLAGVGGRLGSGRHWMSWITLDDVLDVLLRAIVDERLEGPVNAVTDDAVENRDFVQVLGRVLRRPAPLPVPAAALRMAYPGLADEAMLASQRARPQALLDVGHRFRHPRLEIALRHVLGR